MIQIINLGIVKYCGIYSYLITMHDKDKFEKFEDGDLSLDEINTTINGLKRLKKLSTVMINDLKKGKIKSGK